MTSSITDFKNWSVNDYADFWRGVGFNVIPMKGKVPVEKYEQFFDKAIPIELHNYWKKMGLFNNGIAIINGRLWNHEHRKNIFGHIVDTDSKTGTKLIMNVKGVQLTLEDMIKRGIAIESTPRGFHFIIFSDKEFPNLAPNISGIEVKGSNKLTTVTNTMSDGVRRELIGDSMKALENCVIHTEFMYHIDDALKPQGIDYLNGHGRSYKSNNTARILIDTDDNVYQGARNPNLHAYACHILMKYWDKKTLGETQKMVQDMNQKRCVPPLDNQEVEQIYHSALRSVNKEMGSRQQQQSKSKGEEDKPTTTYQQKYSDSQILAEAVIIGKEPCFLVSENGIITPKKEILDGDRIIKPFVSEMYINRPYKFESVSQVQQLIEETKNETLDSLYRLIKSIWTKYIDADNFHITICAADTIFTFFQDKIGLSHYLFFVGNTGSGKSNNLTIFHFLAYRNMTSTGLSFANIYQFLGSGDEGVGTICEDEADNIDEDNEKMKIYKDGYTTGRPTTKTDTTYGRKQLKYNNFCFKAFAAERLPDSMKGKGFIQRILEIPCIYGFPKYDISEVANPAGDDEFQYLLDELLGARNRSLIYRLRHYHEKIPNIKTNLQNREKQLFKPILRVFQNTNALNELLPVIGEYISQKRQANANTFHAYLYDIVKDLIKKNNYELETADIWTSAIAGLVGSEITGKPLSYESEKFGTISRKMITQTMKDVFGARPPKHHGTSSKLIFDKDKFEKIGKIYQLKLKVKVVGGQFEFEDGEDGEDGEDSGSAGLDKHMPREGE